MSRSEGREASPDTKIAQGGLDRAEGGPVYRNRSLTSCSLYGAASNDLRSPLEPWEASSVADAAACQLRDELDYDASIEPVEDADSMHNRWWVSLFTTNLQAVAGLTLISREIRFKESSDFVRNDDSLSACETMSQVSSCSSPIRCASRSVSPQRRPTTLGVSTGHKAKTKLSSATIENFVPSMQRTTSKPGAPYRQGQHRAARVQFIACATTTFTKLGPVGTDNKITFLSKECDIGVLKEMSDHQNVAVLDSRSSMVVLA